MKYLYEHLSTLKRLWEAGPISKFVVSLLVTAIFVLGYFLIKGLINPKPINGAWFLQATSSCLFIVGYAYLVGEYRKITSKNEVAPLRDRPGEYDEKPAEREE